MTLKQKIKKSGQLSKNQKVFLLWNLEKIPETQKEKLEYLLDREAHIREEQVVRVQTAGKRTLKAFNTFLEEHDE